MIAPPLACTVRGCGLPLVRDGRAWTCANRHGYDVARSGYVNLLQPQDRRSAEPGDRRAAVEARVALERAGVADALVGAIAARVAALALPPGGVIVDLGCGSGLALAAVCAGGAAVGIGIDLSTAAITFAARHRAGPTWVVANADRALPLLDGRVDVVLSLHGRRNPPETARVLAPGGRLIVAVPAPDDLVELRAAVQGRGEARDRVPGTITEHEAWFALDEQFRVADRRVLNRESLVALLGATYRGARRSAAAQVERLDALAVTLASDVCVFTRR